MTTKKGEISKQYILKCALEEFATYDFETASLNRICKNSSITKGQLYHHFESKLVLFNECIDAALLSLMKTHEQNIIKYNSVVDAIRDYLNTRNQFTVNHPMEMQLIYRVFASHDEMLVPFQQKYRAFNQSFLSRVISESELKSGLEKEDVVEYYLLVIDGFNMKMASSECDVDERLRQQILILKMMFSGTLKEIE